MNNTYIGLFRDSLKHRYFKNVNLWHFYQYCMLKATYKPHSLMVGNQTVNLEIGEFVFGRKVASSDTGLTEREVRTCLSVLEKDGKVTIKTTNKYSIIKVIKFSSWQDTYKTNDQQHDQQATNKRPQTIKANKVNKKPIEHFPNALEIFEKCWSIYPRKEGKKEAQKHFKNSVASAEDARKLFIAIQIYSRSVSGKEIDFIKHGSSFFNNWRDYEPATETDN